MRSWSYFTFGPVSECFWWCSDVFVEVSPATRNRPKKFQVNWRVKDKRFLGLVLTVVLRWRSLIGLRRMTVYEYHLPPTRWQSSVEEIQYLQSSAKECWTAWISGDPMLPVSSPVVAPLIRHYVVYRTWCLLSAVNGNPVVGQYTCLRKLIGDSSTYLSPVLLLINFYS